MRDYSFRYMDRLGRSGPSDFMKFADDGSATQFGRAGLARNAVVEVWKGSLLLVRLEQSEADAELHAIPGKARAAQADPTGEANSNIRILADPAIILPLHGYARPIR